MRFGIDVGGTFTDVVLMDDTGEFYYVKTPTTHGDLAQGVLNGIADILQISHQSLQATDSIIHGTTIGTNAIVERRGSKVGLLTTKGFEDVLEIRRVARPKGAAYDFEVDNCVGQYGDVIEYRGIDQIFNSQNAYYRENDGQEILADLVKDYYSRIAINRFNANNNGNASIIGIQGSETLGTDNYGETTFGLSEEEGNKFRSWVNDNHPDYASEINLDREFGSFTNSHITKAWKKLGEEYKKSTQFQEYDDLISKYYLK